MVYRECYLSWRIRSHNTIRAYFDYVCIYLRIMKGKGAMGPAKNKVENTNGVPTTGSDINHCPENCEDAPQDPPRPFIPAFYIHLNFAQHFPELYT